MKSNLSESNPESFEEVYPTEKDEVYRKEDAPSPSGSMYSSKPWKIQGTIAWVSG
jgi:hypothetical protein